MAAGGESTPQPCFTEDRGKLDPWVGLVLLHWEDWIKSKTQNWDPFELTVSYEGFIAS